MGKNIYQETAWIDLKDTIKNGSISDRREALVKIKDAVIGSNRQKGALIAHGLIPDILQLCNADNIGDKINALIIIGSLAKGSAEQVEVLVQRFNIIPVLIQEIISENNNVKCIEVCLSTMRSIYEHTNGPVDLFLSDESSLIYFLSLASSESSWKIQICVTSILVSLCQTYDDQIRLLHAGTIHVLARMICFQNENIQIPALRCLACMSFSNRSVSDNVCVTSFQGKSLPDILNSLMSRLFTPEIQLTAAKCLTYIYRSGTLLSTDNRILHKTLPSLVRLCSDTFDQSIRADAADTLAYLIEIDSELQQTAAISNHLLKSLSQLIRSRQPIVKKAALKCFSCLGANDEAIRKRIMTVSGLVDAVIDGLSDSNPQVKLASVRCLHALSRSVQQLRTTFQDYKVWKELMCIISFQPSTDLLVAAISTICNLLLEFSPSKEPLINEGIIEKLCQFTKCSERSLRLNSIWALMNMSFLANDIVKATITKSLGIQRILELLHDSDTHIVTKTLGLLRNLLNKSSHIEHIQTTQILESVNVILESDHVSEIKEQALCIVGNIAAETCNGDSVLNDKRLMTHIAAFLFNQDQRIQAGALFIINNIVHRSDLCSEDKYLRLAELGIIHNVFELNTVRNKLNDEYINRTLKEIISQCKHFCPEFIK